ncbi:MAG: YicC family protein [Clostridiales bacterium]|nr:YicC family protein [Clostridiales bacterium]
MLKSMTGYGRSEIISGDKKITVEIKTVNHRYCDIAIKLPKKLISLENGIRNVIKQYIGRGKVDVYVSYEDYSNMNLLVKYNAELAREYLLNLEKMSQDFGIDNDIRVSTLSRYPDVLTLEEQAVDEDELWEFVEEAVKKALSHLIEARVLEGENLKKDLHTKLEGMLALVNSIEERSPNIITEYREKLKAKVAELLGDTQLDESILATEITIFADKICVDEETVRLRSHILNMKQTLDESDNVGRKLDFIAQEMNREANTILSKANDIEVSNIAIDLKTEIEKMREQIQNIE